jgi:hypothetical protein
VDRLNVSLLFLISHKYITRQARESLREGDHWGDPDVDGRII